MWNPSAVLAVFAALFVLANANPSETTSGQTRVYENQIKAMLEDVRRRMCYNDPDGLPQLEPFLFDDQLDLNLDSEFGEIAGYVRNIKVEGLSSFIVDYLTFALTLKFSVRLLVPKLVLSGEYKLKANLGGFIELDGEDKFRVALGDINLGASAGFLFNQTMSLRDVKLALKLGFVESAIENLSPDEEVNQFLNDAISNLVPKVVDEYLPDSLLESVEKFIEDFATGYLKDLTVSELLGLLSGSGGALFPPLDEEKACAPRDAITQQKPPIVETLPGVL